MRSMPSEISIRKISPLPFRSGVITSLTLSIEQNADRTRLTGLSTLYDVFLFFHDVLIDNESFPTGIVILFEVHRVDIFLTAK